MLLRRLLANLIDISYVIGIFYLNQKLFVYIDNFILSESLKIVTFISLILFEIYLFIGVVFYYFNGSIGKKIFRLSVVSVYGRVTMFRIITREFLTKLIFPLIIIYLYYYNNIETLIIVSSFLFLLLIFDFVVKFYSKNFMRDNYLFTKVINY